MHALISEEKYQILIPLPVLVGYHPFRRAASRWQPNRTLSPTKLPVQLLPKPERKNQIRTVNKKTSNEFPQLTKTPKNQSSKIQRGTEVEIAHRPTLSLQLNRSFTETKTRTLLFSKREGIRREHTQQKTSTWREHLFRGSQNKIPKVHS